MSMRTLLSKETTQHTLPPHSTVSDSNRAEHHSASSNLVDSYTVVNDNLLCYYKEQLSCYLVALMIPNAVLDRTIGRMAKTKSNSGKYKPHRVVRIPERTAKLLEKLAEMHDDTVAAQVRRACKDRLIKYGLIPPQPKPID